MNPAKKLLTKLALHPAFADPDAVHYIGVSGGKDSVACLALAEFAGVRYTGLVCDTHHEKAATYRYLQELSDVLPGRLKTLTRITSEEEFAAKRVYLRREWRKWTSPALRSKPAKELGVRVMLPPVAEEDITRALAALWPTGDAFRDRLVLHGTMPHITGKFCSLELKTELAWSEIEGFLSSDHNGENVYWWSGVRAQESPRRARLPVCEPCALDRSEYVQSFRPILSLSHDQVFMIAKYMGLPTNPLYLRGDARVGCNECFESGKRAIRNTFTRDPEALARVERLERDVAVVSRRAVQEGREYVPFFREAYRLRQYDCWASARQVFEWSQTTRGGVRRGAPLVVTSCDSIYGLCG